jgi:hypothetical protein
MDTQLEQLVATSSLKMNVWKEAVRRKSTPYFYANTRLDMVMVMVVDPRTAKITHFIDEHVALLYLADSREIIGFQIEAFEKSFLPLYSDLQKVWRLSDITPALRSVGDLMIASRKREVQMATALTKVTKPILANAGMDLPAFAI